MALDMMWSGRPSDTCQYERKILKWKVKHQTETNKKAYINVESFYCRYLCLLNPRFEDCLRVPERNKYLSLLMKATCFLVCILNLWFHNTPLDFTSVEHPFAVYWPHLFYKIYGQMLKFLKNYWSNHLMSCVQSQPGVFSNAWFNKSTTPTYCLLTWFVFF